VSGGVGGERAQRARRLIRRSSRARRPGRAAAHLPRARPGPPRPRTWAAAAVRQTACAGPRRGSGVCGGLTELSGGADRIFAPGFAPLQSWETTSPAAPRRSPTIHRVAGRASGG
jgi:hypothetical protein